MGRTLVYGFCGEFGWSLIYNSLIRSLSRQFDKTIVIARPLEEYLYSDFATGFIPYTPNTNLTNYATCKDELPIGFYEKLIDEYCLGDEVHLIPMQTTLVHWSPMRGLFHYNDNKLLNCRHEWKKFGQSTEELKYDLLIHARNTSKLGSGRRNFGVDNWNRFAQRFKGLKMASIGTNDASLAVDGTEDLRGVGLKKVCDLMSSSKLIVGTSSGPMHLAAMVGLRHVVITEKINHNRYMDHFNPFKTPCLLIEKYGWRPPVDAVEGIVKLILTNIKQFLLSL